MRVLLYERVSTDEQARKDLSIPAQHKLLCDYCQDNDYQIVNTYVDEGISAKNIKKRPSLNALLKRLEKKDIDIVLFTRLDRFTRIGRDYYLLSDKLKANGANWNAILEDYDTTTANGQLMLEVKLAVNHNELLRTSERIKDVFNKKVQDGTVLSGKVPLGYKIENKRLVIDQDKELMVRDLFDYFEKYKSKRGTVLYIQDKYDYTIHFDSVGRMIKNTVYYGSYRDNNDFCPAYMNKARWDNLNKISQSGIRRRTNPNRFYYFTGITYCSYCGDKMFITSRNLHLKKTNEDVTYSYYRCNSHYKYHKCHNSKQIREDRLEALLLDRIQEFFSEYEIEYQVKRNKPIKKAFDRDKVIRRMEKLKDLYLDDLITKEVYEKDYNLLKFQLIDNEEDEEYDNFEDIKRILNSDFKTIYKEFDREEKRNFWTSILSSITLKSSLDEGIEVTFR